jgi:hypothetical protein
LFFTPHSSQFGAGCHDRVGIADESNHSAVTSEGVADRNVAASEPYDEVLIGSHNGVLEDIQKVRDFL